MQHITINVMVPPSFLKKPTEQTFPNGMRVRFECQAQGYPTPRIYWLKDAKNITINGEILFIINNYIFPLKMEENN